MSPRREQLVAACQQLLVIGVAAAVIVPATTVVQVDVAAPGERPTASVAVNPTAYVATAPVEPTITDHELAEIPTREPLANESRILARIAESAHEEHPEHEAEEIVAEQELATLSEPTPVSGYATVGVTWDDEVIPEDEITVALRSREGEDWSEWTTFEYDPDHGPDPGSAEARSARPGTGELLVGDVDEVQVAAATEDGELPEGMSLAVVDPGGTADEVLEPADIDTADLGDNADAAASTDSFEDSETDTVEVSEEGDLALSSATARLAATEATPKPRIFSRSQWGANEQLRDASSLNYFEVHAGFVHHTVNANNYTRRDVPALMRGIYAYHTQSRGWSDIGYNFIVDKFGRIWEGRYGGVDRPVVGAHTLGYNEYSFAMSALGNFEEVAPSAAMIDAYARLFAWKLSLHGIAASSKSQYVGSRTFPAINGHRDAGSTACPGRYLYAQLPAIRKRATGYQASFSGRDRTASVSGTDWPDFLLRREGSSRMQVLRTEGQLRFGAGQTATNALSGYDLVSPVGDFDGDGRGDLLARDASTKATRVFLSNGKGEYRPSDRVIKGKFTDMDEIADGGDLNGDGRVDVVAKHADGRLFLYRGRQGGLRKRLLMTANASGYRAIQGAGDIDGDGDEDLIARDSDGEAIALLGSGGRALDGVRRLPGSWELFDVLAAGHDLTGDGRSDVVVRFEATKKVYLLPIEGSMQLGSPQGPFRSIKGVGRLWVVGDGGPEQRLVGRDGDRLVSFLSNGRHNTSDLVTTNVDVSEATQLLNVGDWDGDGHGDVVVRERRYLKLWRGRADGSFAGPTTVSSSFGGVRLLAPAGDMTGNGRPDLIGQPKQAAMRIYPGGGSRIGGGYVAHSAVTGSRQVVVGRWNGDGAPDSLVSRRDGKVSLYPGNGPGGLEKPRPLGGNVSGLRQLTAVGDLDADGRPDVVGIQRTSGNLVRLTRTRKGLGRPLLVDGDFSAYNLLG